MDPLFQERDRWALWIPVGFAIGIGLYFTLPFEPAPLAGISGLCIILAAGLLLRRRRFGVAVMFGVFLLAAGFFTAQLRTVMIPDHMLAAPATGMLSGVVLRVEHRPGRPRLLIGEAALGDGSRARGLEHVRVSVGPRAWLPRIGDRIRVRASLRPPPPPSAPGAHDFQRAAFFERLSAVGFARGPVEPMPEAAPAPFSMTLWLALYRHDLSERIRQVLPGTTGALASALLTGERGALPETMLSAMRDSGLAHLLAISGLHMGLVAGIVFFGLRAGFAVSRRLALRHPIKKWAAVGALIFAAGYLALSGAAVPTQRAFLMTGLVLLAVLVDRTAISMRLVAWAAMLVLLFRPEALLTASFQLSFAAVTALVATYEAVTDRRLGTTSWEGTPGRVARFLGALVLTSLIANLATMPFGAFHFNRIACYGLLSNLLAVPLTGFWVMPWGVLALALAPLGLEGIALAPMGWGLDALARIAHEVARWPGATMGLSAWPMPALVIMTIGGLWLCLWRRAWRGLGVAVIAIGLVAATIPGQPRVLVNGDGDLVGVTDAAQRLLLNTMARDGFSAALWARRAGGASLAHWREVPDLFRCDGIGCVADLDGTTLAFSTSGRALGEDCRHAHILISTAYRPSGCDRPTVVLDRDRLWRSGGAAIWLDDGRLTVRTVAETRGIRPWTAGGVKRD